MALKPIVQEREWSLPPSLVPRVLEVAMAALAPRLLVWIVSGGGITLWTLAVLHPDPWRLLAAAGYCATVLVPVLYHARER
jgi:hypothetical protein